MRAVVTIIPPEPELEKITRPILITISVIISLCLGVKVKLDIVKKVLKKPVAPIVGSFCQFVCMPLIAYSVAKLIPQPSAALSLGTFACGVAPGGGMSNVFSDQLGGDVSLSITMTTISSILALGLIPAWMMTLGQTFSDSTITLKIPFVEILAALSMFIVPNFVGMMIKWKFPKQAKVLPKYILPPAFVFLIGFSIFMIYKYSFIFAMLTAQQVLAGSIMPYFGYLIGGLMAFIARRPWTHIKTISIETGIQNTQVTSAMLYLSMGPPDNLLGGLVPLASSLMTPLPLYIIFIGYKIYQKRKGSSVDEASNSDEKKSHISKNENDDDENNDNEKKDKDNKMKESKDENKKVGIDNYGERDRSSCDDKDRSLWEKKEGIANDNSRASGKLEKQSSIAEDKLDNCNINGFYESQTSVDGLMNTRI